MTSEQRSHCFATASLSLTLLLGGCATVPDIVRTPVPRVGTEAVSASPSSTRASPSPSDVLDRPQPLGTSAEMTHDRNAALTNYALSLLGVKYKFGGNSAATGFDCSGFVNHVFSEIADYALPRNSEAIARRGVAVDRTDLQRGDLVFYNTRSRANSHVGIYLGNNTFIHSPSRGKSVEVVDMTENYWQKRFNGARRLLSESHVISEAAAASKEQPAKTSTRGSAVTARRPDRRQDGTPIADEQ